MKKIYSVGIGIGTKNNQHEYLEFFYPQPLLWPGSSLLDSLATIADQSDGNQVIEVTDKQLVTLAANLDACLNAAYAVRNLVSADTRRVFNDLGDELAALSQGSQADLQFLQDALDRIITGVFEQ